MNLCNFKIKYIYSSILFYEFDKLKSSIWFFDFGREDVWLWLGWWCVNWFVYWGVIR